LNSAEIQNFAREWIAFQKTQQTQDAAFDDPAFEIAFRLSRMAVDAKEPATAICVEISNRSDDPWILEILGAGTLEDILRSHGHDVLPEFLAAAKANPNFRQALRHIWPREDENVWRRFLAVRDSLTLPEK
jgi:hypothetical protein